MTRTAIRKSVTKEAVRKSGRWPRQYDGYRNCGARGRGKKVTLRSHRKGGA